MTTLKTRRGISLLAVIAVATGAAAVPGIATAAPSGSAFGVVATAERLPSLVDLDTNRTGSITIHKLVKDATNGISEGTGLEDSTVTGTPLDGTKFTVERLTNVDLTTQAGWEKLVGFNGDVATAKADGVDAAVEKTTAGGGLATFSNLPLGAYVVTETETPRGLRRLQALHRHGSDDKPEGPEQVGLRRSRIPEERQGRRREDRRRREHPRGGFGDFLRLEVRHPRS